MRRIALILVLPALMLAACGNDRTLAPDVSTVGPPLGKSPATYPKAGITFEAPTGWNLGAGTDPLVATVQTGRATVGIWRYPRTEPLPKTDAELQAARDALLAAAKARDATFTALKSTVLRLDGKRAVQIRGNETIEGQRRMVRSTHVYAGGAEIVVDAIAPGPDFRRVDAQVFRPLLQSLRIARPVK